MGDLERCKTAGINLAGTDCTEYLGGHHGSDFIGCAINIMNDCVHFNVDSLEMLDQVAAISSSMKYVCIHSSLLSTTTLIPTPETTPSPASTTTLESTGTSTTKTTSSTTTNTRTATLTTTSRTETLTTTSRTTTNTITETLTTTSRTTTSTRTETLTTTTPSTVSTSITLPLTKSTEDTFSE